MLTYAVNGRYIRDATGEYQHIGIAYRQSNDPKSRLFDYVLLHEEAFSHLRAGGEVLKDRWLLFFFVPTRTVSSTN